MGSRKAVNAQNDSARVFPQACKAPHFRPATNNVAHFYNLALGKGLGNLPNQGSLSRNPTTRQGAWEEGVRVKTR